MFSVLQNRDIIRLLLCFGDYSVKTGNSFLGEFRFLGQQGKWHRVLASPEGEIKSNFIELFKNFSEGKIKDWNDFLQNSLSNGITQFENQWLWYCLRDEYKTILDYPIFTRNSENRIETFRIHSLNSYHYNPFVFWFRYYSPIEVRTHLDESNSCALHSNYSRLHLKNGVQLEQKNNSWFIYNLHLDFMSEEIKYDEKSGCFVFECQNLIEDLIPFIKSLNSNS